MSGFLPDLANWALRGGAGDDNDNDGNRKGEENSDKVEKDEPPKPAITEADMRARRLARMEALQKNDQKQTHDQSMDSSDDPQPMEIDTDSKPAQMETDALAPVTKKAKGDKNKSLNPDSLVAVEASKKKSSEPTDPVRRIQRKKELLIKKVLNVTIYDHQARDPTCIHIDIGLEDNGKDDGIDIQTVAELLATRLSIEPSKLRESTPAQKPFILYLATAHRKAGDEAKTLRQHQKESNKPLIDILNEIQVQVVSYAASGLLEPDLFEQAFDSRCQLARAMIEFCGGGDPLKSLSFGVTGKSDSSFYHRLCDELHSQNVDSFRDIVDGVVATLAKHLKQCENIDSTTTVDTADAKASKTTAQEKLSCGPTQLLSALVSVCGHKKAALVVAKMSNFLLPKAGSAAAEEIVRPPMPVGADFFRMLTGGGNTRRPYKKRSGVGLEEQTLLGSVFRISVPRTSNPAFSSDNLLRQPHSVIEQITRSERQRIKLYQSLLNQLVMNFVKAGKDSRSMLFSWFVDCQIVNPSATGMRPDYQTKVSSPSLLLNVSIVLLKLCEPFVSDEKKHILIDPMFVFSPKDNLGAFPIKQGGDDVLPRLGGDEREDSAFLDSIQYKPKNAFVPQCFFFTARSISLGIAPLLSQHENLLRNISHRHWQVDNGNGSISSDPQFRIMIIRQRSIEVSLFQEDMVAETLEFCNLMAKILYEMDNDNILKNLPEVFVENICDILIDVAKFQPNLLRGGQFRYVFKSVVKLLGPKYTNMIRNYNLRAKLGDTLYTLFLPESKPRFREIPQSIAMDPQNGGQFYLLSDREAQDSLAPSLLLLYGEVEQTGHYDKQKHRSKISSLIKYLWNSKEHRPAFEKITSNKDSFIKFANGIINETNQLISTVMEKLPKIRIAQELMANANEWSRLTEEEQTDVTSRLEDDEMDVKMALPLCNRTLQMFQYLNTDEVIRNLFLLPELCPRLVNMLIHVLGKLIGSKGLDLKVENPEQYEFRPKEMLRDLCAIFAQFSAEEIFQTECAKSGCDIKVLRSSVKKCQKLGLLSADLMTAFDTLPDIVEKASQSVAQDEELVADAPDEFLDEILTTFMRDPVILPSGHSVDRSTITQHLLNDPIDPFNRKPMTIEDIKPNHDLKAKIDAWLREKHAARMVVGK